MKVFLRIAACGCLCLMCLFAIMLFRTWQVHPEPRSKSTAVTIHPEDSQALQHLSTALKIKTVSHTGEPVDRAAMQQFTAFLQKSFPEAFQHTQTVFFPDGSLLMKWPGHNASLPPIVLMAHFDTVPVDDDTLAAWKHGAFSGDLADGAVWGRGAVDDKSQVLSQLEAVTMLLQSGFQPARTVYFSFGDDEENGGTRGAGVISAYLKQQGVQPAMVLDEGGFVLHHVLAGIDMPTAIVGIAEKGYADVRLSVDGTPGHSSNPPPHTAIGELAAALTAVERKPYPYAISSVMQEQFKAMEPYVPFGKRLVLANTWITKPLILSGPKHGENAASFHTTTAETIVRGGTKSNVLPNHAEATINIRIMPGETVQSVLAGLRERVADPGIKMDLLEGARDPSAVSSPHSEAYQTLRTTIEERFPDAVVIPYLTTGATDASYFTSISNNIYRFSPLELDAHDLVRFHGVNERIEADRYLNSIRFHYQLLLNSCN